MAFRISGSEGNMVMMLSLGLPTLPYLLIKGQKTKQPKPYRNILAKTLGVGLGIVLVPVGIVGLVIGGIIHILEKLFVRKRDR